MVLGLHLVFALLAGAVFWFVSWLCARFGAPTWLSAILSFGLGIYTWWFLSSGGVIVIGR